MIGRLRGEVVEVGPNQLVIDVGGVGYVVMVSRNVAVELGERIELHIYTAVRDDAITLFGFQQRVEKRVFDLLIGVPGVGPVKAMNILQTPVPVFAEMIMQRNVSQLAKLPGVGKKTAERLLVDLTDKLDAMGLSEAKSAAAVPAYTPSAISLSPVMHDLVSALVNLGFKEAAATETAKASISALGERTTLDVLLRDALARSRPS